MDEYDEFEGWVRLTERGDGQIVYVQMAGGSGGWRIGIPDFNGRPSGNSYRLTRRSWLKIAHWMIDQDMKERVADHG